MRKGFISLAALMLLATACSTGERVLEFDRAGTSEAPQVEATPESDEAAETGSSDPSPTSALVSPTGDSAVVSPTGDSADGSSASEATPTSTETAAPTPPPAAGPTPTAELTAEPTPTAAPTAEPTPTAAPTAEPAPEPVPGATVTISRIGECELSEVGCPAWTVEESGRTTARNIASADDRFEIDVDPQLVGSVIAAAQQTDLATFTDRLGPGYCRSARGGVDPTVTIEALGVAVDGCTVDFGRTDDAFIQAVFELRAAVGELTREQPVSLGGLVRAPIEPLASGIAVVVWQSQLPDLLAAFDLPPTVDDPATISATVGADRLRSLSGTDSLGVAPITNGSFVTRLQEWSPSIAAQEPVLLCIVEVSDDLRLFGCGRIQVEPGTGLEVVAAAGPLQVAAGVAAPAEPAGNDEAGETEADAEPAVEDTAQAEGTDSADG